MPRQTRDRSASSERKKHILQAALTCFDVNGVEATTIADLHRAAQCSVGSLYHHFGNKEGVAEELFLEGIAQLNRGMLRKLKTCSSGEESVRAVVSFYCDWSVRHQQMARYLHSRDIPFSPDAKARLKEIHRAYIISVFSWFGPFVASGEMLRLPADTYVPLISGPIQEYVRRWLSGQAGNPSKVKGIFADAAWNAVKGLKGKGK
ncbi:MAG: TetR/AcrR family transcriptional regulator [Proteobacteria bacterium]|nr:TetR/AcrR family transcriptional regulator [Pseudomonadota bacterium]